MSSRMVRICQLVGFATLVAAVCILAATPIGAQPPEPPADADKADSEGTNDGPYDGAAGSGGAAAEATADAAAASPEQVKESCVRSFVAAQKLTRDGKLTAARKELVACAQDACPEVTKPLCVEWLREVTLVLPSIIITARDAAGKDTVAVRVTIDGEVVMERLDGRPWPLDPGRHKLRFEHGDAPPIEKVVVLAQGQRNRPVTVSWAADEPPPAPTETPQGAAPALPDRADPEGVSPIVYVGFSFATAGLIAGTVTGIMSLSTASDLEESCPDKACPPDIHTELDTSYTLAHVSTVSFAVAGAGAAVGLIALILSWPDSADETESGVSLQPTVGMGSFGLVGSF